jgi:hypothetical protein
LPMAKFLARSQLVYSMVPILHHSSTLIILTVFAAYSALCVTRPILTRGIRCHIVRYIKLSFNLINMYLLMLLRHRHLCACTCEVEG